MAGKKTPRASEGAASQAASFAEELAPKDGRKLKGNAAMHALQSGLVPPPPAGALDGLVGGPEGQPPIRRGGRLMPAPAPPPPDARYLPGRPLGAPTADFSGFPTAVKRQINPTFHAPPPEKEEARQRAIALRSILGQALMSLEMAYHEAMQAEVYLKQNPSAAAEFAREGIDLAQVRKFADEADDVINMFAPPEEGS